MSGNTSTLTNSPVALQAGSYSAQQLRNLCTAGGLPGLVQYGDFAVTQRAAGANMSVDIAAGQAFVNPTAVTYQGSYLVQNDSSYNTSSDGGYTWTAADGSNPRIDLVCIEVKDNAHDAGGINGFRIRIVDGTPNASATHQLMTTYWPAVPAGCIPIAAVRIPASDTTIGTSEITNLNPIGGVGRASTSWVTSAETTTSASYARLATPDFVTVYVPHTKARIRVCSEGWWKISVASGTQGITLFLNDTQLKARNGSNAAPAVAGREIASLGTFHSRFQTEEVFSSSTYAFFDTTVGATADVSDVTTGVAATASSRARAIEITQLAAGWYVIEQRYKTSANTLTVDERRMWAEVIH